MSSKTARPQPGSRVVLKHLPPGLLDDLPPEDQQAIEEIVGKPVKLAEYDNAGRAELEFTDRFGVIHFVYVDVSFLSAM
jgi:hypothetical protein